MISSLECQAENQKTVAVLKISAFPLRKKNAKGPDYDISWDIPENIKHLYIDAVFFFKNYFNKTTEHRSLKICIKYTLAWNLKQNISYVTEELEKQN